jgi:hypothetical protein
MSDPQERENLEALLASPAWHQLLRRAKAQWAGDGYGRAIKQAIAQALAEQRDVATAVQMVDAQSNAVNEFMSWPQERIKQLEQLELERKALLEPPLSRRGNL